MATKTTKKPVRKTARPTRSRATTKTPLASTKSKTAAPAKASGAKHNMAGDIGPWGWLIVAVVMVYLGWIATQLGSGSG